VKAKQSGTVSEDILHASVLCEIGDREIHELNPDENVAKKKAFILTDKYHPTRIREVINATEIKINTPENMREESDHDYSKDESNNKDGAIKKFKSSDQPKGTSKTQSMKTTPRSGSHEDNIGRSSKGKSRSSSSSKLSYSNSTEEIISTEEVSPNLSEHTPQEMRVPTIVVESITISHWFNSLIEISESNNSKFTEILKQQNYIFLDTLLQYVPLVHQLITYGIPIYYANYIHSKIIQEKQARLTKCFENSISLWLESLRISVSFLGSFSSAGYGSLQAIFLYPPAEQQLLEMKLPLLHINQILTEISKFS